MVQADIDEEAFAAAADDDDSAAIENTIFILEQKKYDENALKQVMEFLLNFMVLCLFLSCKIQKNPKYVQKVKTYFKSKVENWLGVGMMEKKVPLNEHKKSKDFIISQTKMWLQQAKAWENPINIFKCILKCSLLTFIYEVGTSLFFISTTADATKRVHFLKYIF